MENKKNIDIIKEGYPNISCSYYTKFKVDGAIRDTKVIATLRMITKQRGVVERVRGCHVNLTDEQAQQELGRVKTLGTCRDVIILTE